MAHERLSSSETETLYFLASRVPFGMEVVGTIAAKMRHYRPAIPALNIESQWTPLPA